MLPRAVLLMVASCVLTSCSLAAAPSFELFGAYFPAWMLCGIIAAIASLAARAVFLSAGLADIVPFQLPVCVGVGLIVAESIWLLWFA